MSNLGLIDHTANRACSHIQHDVLFTLPPTVTRKSRRQTNVFTNNSTAKKKHIANAERQKSDKVKQHPVGQEKNEALCLINEHYNYCNKLLDNLKAQQNNEICFL